MAEDRNPPQPATVSVLWDKFDEQGQRIGRLEREHAVVAHRVAATESQFKTYLQDSERNRAEFHSTIREVQKDIQHQNEREAEKRHGLEASINQKLEQVAGNINTLAQDSHSRRGAESLAKWAAPILLSLFNVAYLITKIVKG